MDNLHIYEKVRSVPKEALKEISAGRLRGKSDINPMWRIKELTNQFGPCGIGWKYEITKQWLEQGANGEISAFTNINLYVKFDGEWSAAIPGTGGSAFVAKESKGLYTSDECYKMALTDAISVACKALGFAADVYWSTDKSKYENRDQISSNSIRILNAIRQELGKSEVDFLSGLTQMLKREVKSLKDITDSEAIGLIKALNGKLEALRQEQQKASNQ